MRYSKFVNIGVTTYYNSTMEFKGACIKTTGQLWAAVLAKINGWYRRWSELQYMVYWKGLGVIRSAGSGYLFVNGSSADR